MKKIIFVFTAILSAAFLLGQAAADSSYTKVGLEDFKVEISSKRDETPVLRSYKKFALKQPDDKWFSPDKWSHLTTAYFAALQTTYTADHFFLAESKNAETAGICVSVSLSLGKEFYDAFYKKTYFSWKDLAYDMLGTSLAYMTMQKIR